MGQGADVNKETGGQAFPVTGLSGLANNEFIYPMTGMTLRDYFAAKAMQGMLAHPECDYTPMGANAQKQAAADAYGMADEMLKARSA